MGQAAAGAGGGRGKGVAPASEFADARCATGVHAGAANRSEGADEGELQRRQHPFDQLANTDWPEHGELRGALAAGSRDPGPAAFMMENERDS